MALIRNIAGLGAVPASGGAASAAKGLYSGILTVVGQAAAATPEGAIIEAVKQGINLLPPGGLKTWLTRLSDPQAFAAWIVQMIKGRTYTTGQYKLAERYIDQVLSPNGPNTIKSNADVQDTYVPQAILFFTVVFGVRITTDEDLWALDSGATAYLARPGLDYKGMADASSAALQRAVFLKQSFYPASTYNVSTWDLDHFSDYPLVSPIPDPYTFGKLYTGPLPGGGNATDGKILVNASTPLSSVAPATGAPDEKNNNSLLIIGGLLLAAGAWFYYGNKPKKRVYG
jgi:LPXTG-motif cell wall-anchored protein